MWESWAPVLCQSSPFPALHGPLPVIFPDSAQVRDCSPVPSQPGPKEGEARTCAPRVSALCPSVLIRPRTNIYLAYYKQEMGEGGEKGWARGCVEPAGALVWPRGQTDRQGAGGPCPWGPRDLGWPLFPAGQQVLGGERK